MLKNTTTLVFMYTIVLALSACGQTEQPDPQLAEEPPSQEAHRDFGDYRVHFNALSTDNLAPEVARAYGIVRSKNRAMLNVTVTRRQAGGASQPVRAAVSVSASNLTGQLKNLRMRELTEGEGDGQAVYYIGETPVADGETLIFEISVLPAGESASYQLRYRKQFFTG